jgi:hypothetical protein
MRVPDALTYCVVYVGFTEPNANGVEQEHYVGSGFQICHEENGKNFYYLVTADHIAKGIQGKRSWIRVNRKGIGGADNVSIEAVEWFNHPTDRSVDAAVCIWEWGDAYAIEAVPTEGFIHDEEDRVAKGVGIGDECFSIGIFVLAKGERSNTPLLRYGTIAMIPADRVTTTAYGDIEAYLTEARSLGGVSGAPVFVRESVTFPFLIHRKKEAEIDEGTVYPTGSGSFFLLGLNHGHFEIDKNDFNSIYFRNGEANIGLSVVVPAVKILEILDRPELKERRDETVA